MHPVKELHYYDTLFGVREARVLKVFSANQLSMEWDRLIGADDFSYIDKRYKCFVRTNKILWRQNIRHVEYQDLFRPLLGENTHHGEITPEYMVLPEAGVRRMRRDLGDARIILLARHPVRRFVSAFKLLKAYGKASYEAHDFERELRQAIEDMPAWMAHQDALNDYDTALRRFGGLFKNVLALPYDLLVTQPAQTRRRLQDFLRVDVDGSAMERILETRVNALGDVGEIGVATEKRLRDRYAASDRFLAETFGPDACRL